MELSSRMRLRLEENIQADCVSWFVKNYPHCMIYSVPNEAAAIANGNFSLYNKLKLMGLKPGVADLVVTIPNEMFYVEVKKPGGRQSKTQEIFQKKIEKLGFKYYLIFSVDEFQNLIQSKFNTKR